MKVCRFLLTGNTAHFKIPDMSENFTFGHIHKVALLGLFGAILGLNGYGRYPGDMNGLPEFYQKLNKLHLCVIPKTENGCFRRFMHTFANATKFANKSHAGNEPATLIVQEQWLEKPSWEICFLLDSQEAVKLAEYLQNERCFYMPYLGKTEHLANILEVSVEDIMEVPGMTVVMSGLVPYDSSMDTGNVGKFSYEESLPIALDDDGYYIYQVFRFTDVPLQVGSHYQLQDGRHIVLY